jgi:hypothetical protein
LSSEISRTPLDSFYERYGVRRNESRRAVEFLLKELLGGACSRKALLRSARNRGVIGSEATFQKYLRWLRQRAFVRNIGSKAKFVLELTPLGIRAAQRPNSHVVTLREDSNYFSLDAELAANVDLDKHEKSSAEDALVEIAKHLNRFAETRSNDGEVDLTFTYTLKARKPPRRVQELLEDSLRFIEAIDPTDAKAEWMSGWHQSYAMGLGEILEDTFDREQSSADPIFGLFRHRASLRGFGICGTKRSAAREVLDEIHVALHRLKSDFSKKDDVYHLASLILGLDSIPPAMGEIEEAIHALEKMTAAEVPMGTLLKTTDGPNGKRRYTYFEWLRQTNMPQLVQFEEWLKQKHQDGLKIEMNESHAPSQVSHDRVALFGPQPLVNHETWKGCARYYNIFLTESLRGQLMRRASSASSYLAFIGRVPMPAQVERAIEKFLASRKPLFLKIERLLSKPR